MTDLLDRVAPVASELLHRVDATLTAAGAPPTDPIWSLVRHLRVLPGEAVATLAGWRPEPLGEVGRAMTEAATGCLTWTGSLPTAAPWRGPAATAYELRWAALRAQVSGPDELSLTGRLFATARYTEELVAWLVRSRDRLAAALAEVLQSAEAVMVVTGTEPVGPAAAGIGRHVLATVAASHADGERLRAGWQARLLAPATGPSASDPGRDSGLADGTVHIPW